MKNNPYLLFYKNRFLYLFIFFGLVSIIAELVIIRSLTSFGVVSWGAKIVGFLIGLAFAFILNVRFNFHIAPPKRKKALFYFALISSVSFLVQLMLRNQLVRVGVSSYDLSRLIVAGALFFLSYLLHRKFSFRDYKKVGIAIYADGVEDIRSIFNKIGSIADFIHIDIVDETFKRECSQVKAYRAEVVRAYWPNLPIEVHIMSRNPSRWFSELAGHVDVVYVHLNLAEDLHYIFQRIKDIGAKPGLVLGLDDSVNAIQPYLTEIENVLILAIAHPGASGQEFKMSALELIEKVNTLVDRPSINLCVDGGVNATTIKYLSVESVVSGSFILNAVNPKRNIMLLQTSGEYERF